MGANKISSPPSPYTLNIFLPINPLGNNAGEHNESVVPVKCIDGQLGSGRLIDFALTSGRPAGPWHAWRLMSPFTCKFKEIMRASPRKFTHKKRKKKKGRRRHPFIQSGGPSEHFYWKARLLRSLIWYQAQIFGGFSVVTEQKSARGAPTRVISRSFSFTLQDQSLPSTGFKKKIL